MSDHTQLAALVDSIEARIDRIEQGLTMTREGLRQLTVIGYYTDVEDNFYTSHFWAENVEHALEQACDEVGDEAAQTLVFVAVLEGACLLAPGSP